MKLSLLKVTNLAVLACLCAGCRNSPGLPERPKLPETEDTATWEGIYSFPGKIVPAVAISGLFTSVDTLVEGYRYMSITMRYSALDSIAMALVNAHEPMAGSIATMLRRSGKAGVMLDFRSDDNQRADQSAAYTVKDDKGTALALIFIWDQFSAFRADLFINKLQQLSGIIVIRNDSSKTTCY